MIIVQYPSFILEALEPVNTRLPDTFSHFQRGCGGFLASSFLERRQRPAEATQNYRHKEHDSENGDHRY
jgi:hypothetical protein